jgi:outer membrane protein assembly factor BamB
MRGMLGALLLVSMLGTAGSPAAVPRATGLTPVQRFEGLDHEGQVSSATADEAVVVPRWSSHEGARVSLVGGGERADSTIPSCGSRDCVWHDDRLIVAESGGGRDEQVVCARRPGGGDPEWTRSLGPGNVLDLAVAGGFIVVLRAPAWSTTADEVLGLDGEGAVAWRRPAPVDALTWLATSGTELLVLTPGQVHIVDGATGKTRQVLDIPGGNVERAFVTGDALLVAQGQRRPELLRIERRDGKVTWQARAPAIIALHVVDDLLLACTSGSNLVAYALDDGRRLWDHGPGFSCTSLWTLPVAAGRPSRVIAAGPSGSFVLLEVDPSPAAAERFTIHGRVLIDRRPQRGVVVHVGDRITRSDDEGRYRVSGRGRGIVRVWAELPPEPRPGRVLSFVPEQRVELSGKRRYRGDLVTHTVFDDH